MGLEIPRSVKPMVDFTIHVVVGALAFLVVLAVAVTISVCVKAADGLVPPFITNGGEMAEKALFGVDLVLFGLFVLSEVLKMVRGLWNEWSE
jgi:hypothetical protein